MTDDRISFKIPASISHTEASTVPLACATPWLVLCSKDCLNLDRFKDKAISMPVQGGCCTCLFLPTDTVWFGSDCRQLASMCSLDVVTTCSPRHADLVRLYGARRVFGYKNAMSLRRSSRRPRSCSTYSIPSATRLHLSRPRIPSAAVEPSALCDLEKPTRRTLLQGLGSRMSSYGLRFWKTILMVNSGGR